MAMRLSGLMSGMDTESIVSQLVEARKTKVTKAVKAQKSLKYKQDAWKTLNTQIVGLYSKTLNNLRFESSFTKKKTKVSNSNAVSVITGEGAMNSVQSLKIKELAQSGYMTGGKLEAKGQDGKSVPVTSKTTLSELGFDGTDMIRVQIGDDEESRTPIKVDGTTTIGSFVSALRQAGVNANFDEENGRIYVAAKGSGKENDFSLTGYYGVSRALDALKLNSDTDLVAKYNSDLEKTKKAYMEEYAAAADDAARAAVRVKYGEVFNFSDGTDTDGNPVTTITVKDPNKMPIIGDDGKPMTWDNGELETSDYYAGVLNFDKDGNAIGLKSGCNRIEGKDAKIELNGAEYTSSSNSFHVNGLTLAVSATTGENETITLTTEDDTDGIYDMIKNFFKEYNSLINQMDKLYNADSAKGYEPLTDEEKEAMSDSQIEEWDNKIKDSILRKDSTLGSLATAMKTVMMQGVNMKTGKVDDQGNEITKKMYLSNFGINTLGYFTAPENEKNAYHIDGDSDDADTSGNADKLKSMIANDPDTVIEFFTGLANNLYNEMFDKLDKASEYSSFHTAYDDKKMKSEYDDYTVKIKELEDKLADYEDKWYAKFAAMESALAKMQNNASAVTALLGG